MFLASLLSFLFTNLVTNGSNIVVSGHKCSYLVTYSNIWPTFINLIPLIWDTGRRTDDTFWNGCLALSLWSEIYTGSAREQTKLSASSTPLQWEQLNLLPSLGLLLTLHEEKSFRCHWFYGNSPRCGGGWFGSGGGAGNWGTTWGATICGQCWDGNRNDLINMCVPLCLKGFSFFSLCQFVHFRS